MPNIRPITDLRNTNEISDLCHAYIAETLLEPGTTEKLLDALEEAVFSLESFPQRGAPSKTGAYANKGY